MIGDNKAAKGKRWKWLTNPHYL